MTALTLDVGHRLGDFHLEARFASQGRLTALFGRSGSGKTTLVNMIAGLVRPQRGRIAIGDQVLFDRAAGVDVPPHRRRIGYVFQEGRLFPHLTVRQNLLYGRWFAPRTGDPATLAAVVDLLGIGHLLQRRPALLSGGEKQRVAIGRALLAGPRMLLLDEPLASLDPARKDDILPYIERLRDEFGIPMVYVSHAIGEVARLADTLVVLSDGRVQAAGAVADVLSRVDLFPHLGRYEAGALVSGTVASHDDAYGLTVLRTSAGELRIPRVHAPAGTLLRLRIRARDVMLALAPPAGISALNVLAATVTEIGPPSDAVADVRLASGSDVLVARLTRYSIDQLGLVPGRAVFAVIKSVAFDRRSRSAATIPGSADAADGGAEGDLG